ncbi:MAG TPA: hypothetical protein VKA67_00250, partial [Verrucomicrobiae bacterium]|nr:hypothetical protein [Verrucomicrobiae bacterium]
MVEQRTHQQITGKPMKFLTLADWTGMVKTELFAQTCKSYGLATVRYPMLEVTATVESFDSCRLVAIQPLRSRTQWRAICPGVKLGHAQSGDSG